CPGSGAPNPIRSSPPPTASWRTPAAAGCPPTTPTPSSGCSSTWLRGARRAAAGAPGPGRRTGCRGGWSVAGEVVRRQGR
ncbi:MAG: hypothetical protein AVDCRST_MAG66-4151, partial [uncultured Pseudonocardia sp.]